MLKLHIPAAGAATACNRQLNNNRAGRAQTAANVSLATSLDEYLAALAKGQACRHCGREVGLVPKLVRVQRDANGEEGDESDEQ